jgi:hypothetical protein
MELKMNLLLPVALLLTLSACTHAVHKLEVEPKVKASIHQTLDSQCGSSCEMKACWHETESVVVCKVSFSFVSDHTQREILNQSSEVLAKQDLRVGFCGHDSFGTVMMSAFIGGLIGGAISRGVGGGSYSGSVAGGAVGGSSDTEAIYKDQELIERACSSDPQGLYKRAG